MLNGQNWEFDQVMMEGVKETQSQKIKDILLSIMQPGHKQDVMSTLTMMNTYLGMLSYSQLKPPLRGKESKCNQQAYLNISA